MKLSWPTGGISAEVWTFAGVLLGSLFLLHLLYARLLTRASHEPREPEATDLNHRLRHWILSSIRAVGLPAAILAWTIAFRILAVRVAPLLSASEREAAQLSAMTNLITGVVLVVAGIWLLLRISRVADVHLRALAGRTSSRIDDILLPFVAHAIRVLLPLVAILFLASSLEFDREWKGAVRDGTSILIIGAVAYLLFELTGALQAFVLVRHPLNALDNYRARAIHTQVKVLRRVAVVLISVLTFASMLMVFDSVRRFGTTLLASAGVAGVVIGFAAQRSIATLLAGFQIAITQPIRLDDNVIVEKPFQNWTRTSTQILGTVFLYVDYQVPLEELRAEFERVVRGSSLWDQQVCGMQVTDAKESYIEIRGLLSASDAGKLWDLRCEVREKLVTWVAERFPGALPRSRVQFAPREQAA